MLNYPQLLTVNSYEQTQQDWWDSDPPVSTTKQGMSKLKAVIFPSGMVFQKNFV